MSKATFDEAFAPIEHLYKMQVMEATWGHLAPKKGITYRGHIVWALDLYDSGYLNPKILACELPGMCDSPWFYNAMIDFLQSIHEEMFKSYDRTSPNYQGKREQATAGTVWRWDGTFCNYKWKGKFVQLNVPGLTEVSTTLRRPSAKLTKQDFERLASEVRALPPKQRVIRVSEILPELKQSNGRFDERRFKAACGL